MSAETESWSTQQLVEFLATVSAHRDAEGAILDAAESAAESLDAEISAVILDGRVEATIGYPRNETPEPERFLAAIDGGSILIPGLDECPVISAPIETERRGTGWLMLARHSDEELTTQERDLLRGMGRVLAMTLDSVNLLESVSERQRLLEKLSRLQRSIASRDELSEVLDAIVEGAIELIGDEMAGLRLISEDDPDQMELVSISGLEDGASERIRRSPIGEGAGGQAISERRLVVLEGYETQDSAIPSLADDGLRAAMAAPIFERGRVAGSLAVASRRPGRTYSELEREMLTAFAEHAGLALNDARAVAESVHQAFHDPLTGLPNRAYFLDRLEQVLSETTAGSGVAVLFADLDGFKTVNDSLGHQAGDDLLVMVARRLQRRNEADRTVARFGGDEFAVLLEGVVGRNEARHEAERLLEAFDDPFEVRGREVHISASVGISGSDSRADDLLRNADLAMYQAKSRGKGRVEVFKPGMHAAVVRRLELEADLKRAIDRDELLLHYQPLRGIRGREMIGLEALVRWEHPTRGLIPPNDFIPLAEESGQILAIGRWVLREACRQAAIWESRYSFESPLQMGVNISGIQLQQPELVEEVRMALERSGLRPENLMLEITETELMANTGENIERLGTLRELGIQLAVDDFGTGYSSLEYLRRFPIDVLKIARSFIDGLADEGEGLPLVRAILDLARSFNLTVVAEGIEEPVQQERLIELGCPLGQGFHLGRPAEASVIDSLLMHEAIGTDSAPTEASEPSSP